MERAGSEWTAEAVAGRLHAEPFAELLVERSIATGVICQPPILCGGGSRIAARKRPFIGFDEVMSETTRWWL